MVNNRNLHTRHALTMIKQMGNSIRIFLITFALLFLSRGSIAQQIQQMLDSLSPIYGFSYEKLETDSSFNLKYLLQFEQSVDPGNEEAGKFLQRVFISHKSIDAPVVLITEGYAARHAENPHFRSELAGLLDANQICVEHRYFGTSVPDRLVWDNLTVANSAADLHRIVLVLKNIYRGKWVSTGISKGGQTTVYYKYYYPDDVDISVAYVAPLNFSIEEKRAYHFLNNVGSEACRKKIQNFQLELLKNKEVYLEKFRELAEQKSLTYKIGYERAFELTVFEYSFAFWQWGYYSCEQIPTDFSQKDSIIKHLDKVADIRWVSDQGIAGLQPFFYQAMRELGFYGYDIEPFRKWTVFSKNPTFEFTLPDGVHVSYDPSLNEETDCFIRHKAKNMIFVYGAYDPWSAPAVDLVENTNSFSVIKPGGSHRTRIKDLTEFQQEMVMDSLRSWLNE